MEKGTAVILRAARLMTEARDIDRLLGEIEKENTARHESIDRRIFDLRARLINTEAGLQVIAERAGFPFYR